MEHFGNTILAHLLHLVDNGCAALIGSELRSVEGVLDRDGGGSEGGRGESSEGGSQRIESRGRQASGVELRDDGDGVERSRRSSSDGVDSISAVADSRNLRENGSGRGEGEKESVESHDCAVGERDVERVWCERRKMKGTEEK